MKAVLILALALLNAAPVFAQGTWQQHEAEARQFLVPCPQKDAKDRHLCMKTQQTFVKTYVDAMTGDLISTVALILAFTPTDDKTVTEIMAPGIPANPVEACAWSYLLFKLIGRQPAYQEVFFNHCDPIGEDGRHSAMLRVKALANSFAMGAAPPPNWKPRIDGLRDY